MMWLFKAQHFLCVPSALTLKKLYICVWDNDKLFGLSVQSLNGQIIVIYRNCFLCGGKWILKYCTCELVDSKGWCLYPNPVRIYNLHCQDITKVCKWLMWELFMFSTTSFCLPTLLRDFTNIQFQRFFVLCLCAPLWTESRSKVILHPKILMLF